MSESVPKFLCIKVNKQKKTAISPKKKPQSEISEREKVSDFEPRPLDPHLINEVEKVIGSDENKTITEDDDDNYPYPKENNLSVYRSNDLDLLKEGIFHDEERMIVELVENENSIPVENKRNGEINKNDDFKLNENSSIKTLSEYKKEDINEIPNNNLKKLGESHEIQKDVPLSPRPGESICHESESIDLSLLEKNSVFNLGRWQTEEHQRFIQAMFLYGNEWRKVQEYIGTRSSTQARSHAQKFFIRLKKRFSSESYPDLTTIKKRSEKILNLIRDYIPPEVAAKANDDSRRKFLKVIMNLMSPTDFKQLSRQSELELSLDNKISENQGNSLVNEQQPSNFYNNCYTFSDSSNDKFYLQESQSCQEYNSYYPIRDEDYIRNLILDLNPTKSKEEVKIRIPITTPSLQMKRKNEKAIFKITKDYRRKKRIHKKMLKISNEKLISSVLSHVSQDSYKKEDFCDLEEFFKISTKKSLQVESENKEKQKIQNGKENLTTNNNSVVNTQYFNPNHQNYINIVNINFEKGNSLDGNAINSISNLMANSFNQNNYENFDEFSVNNNYTNKLNLNYIGNKTNKSKKKENTAKNSSNNLNTNLFSNFNNLSQTGLQNNNQSNSFNNANNSNINNNNQIFNPLSINNLPNPFNFLTNLPTTSNSDNIANNSIEKLNAMSRVIKLYQFMLQSNIKNNFNNNSNNQYAPSNLNNFNNFNNLENSTKTNLPLIDQHHKINQNEIEEVNLTDIKSARTNNTGDSQQNFENINKILSTDIGFLLQRMTGTSNNSGMLPSQTNVFSNFNANNNNSSEGRRELSSPNIKPIPTNKDAFSFDGLFGLGPKETGFDGLEEEIFRTNFFESQKTNLPKQENKDFDLDEYFI